jgi:microcystin degradation protein MlrC
MKSAPKSSFRSAPVPPSGLVDHEAYQTFRHLITGAVAEGGFDAIWLDLHGAMVAEKFDDGEGELLSV